MISRYEKTDILAKRGEATTATSLALALALALAVLLATASLAVTNYFDPQVPSYLIQLPHDNDQYKRTT